MDNHTHYTDFYILAFAGNMFSNTSSKHILFVLFGFLYLICILWNLIIITIVYLDPRLQIPMYFFLCNLSFVDVSYSSVTLPKLMNIILSGNNRVSFIACFAQLYFFTSMACTEIVLLTAMAFDRYVAICNPLHYAILMKKKNCILLVICSWVVGSSNSLFVTMFASRLSFCSSRNINQLFCDIKVLTKISCGNTDGFHAMIYIEAVIMGLCPFLIILMSYAKILSSILRINVAKKRMKTFSTCTSHLTVLLLFYGTLLCMYMKYSPEQDKFISIFYVAVVPMLNPLVYSLRNEDVLGAIKKLSKPRRSRI
uniref:Olfactory receptor n=1 Tax=Leptobrachium leishanense TaxID=445787 RepID=A0A8C5PTH7_9ANUR